MLGHTNAEKHSAVLQADDCYFWMVHNYLLVPNQEVNFMQFIVLVLIHKCVNPLYTKSIYRRLGQCVVLASVENSLKL